MPSSLPPRPSSVSAVLRGLSLRCPRCGKGRFAKGLFQREDACGTCGQAFKLETGEFTGAAYIGYFLNLFVLAIVFVILVAGFKMELESTLWVLVPLGVAFPILLHRHSIGAFMGVLIATGAMEDGLEAVAPHGEPDASAVTRR